MRPLLLSVVMWCLAPQAFSQFTATITASGSTTFCQGSSVYLMANAGADAYQWYLNGIAISGANDDTLEAGNAGNYEVVVDSAGYVDTSLPEAVTVNTVPAQPGPISGPDTFCAGSSQTFAIAPVLGAADYTWRTVTTQNIGNTYVTTTDTFRTGPIDGSWSNTAQVEILVSANNACGSSAVQSLHVAVYSQIMIGGMDSDPDISSSQGELCPGVSTKLHVTTHPGATGCTVPVAFQWYNGNNLIPGATGQYLTIYHGGPYWATISSNGICPTQIDHRPVPLTMPLQIIVTPSGPVDFCLNNVQPLEVSFDTSNVDYNVDWIWTIDGENIPGSFNQLSLLPAASGVYAVHFISSPPNYPYGGCQAWSDSVIITVPPVLEVTQIDDTLFATPGYSSYQWFESGSYISGATSQSYVLSYDGIYSVEATYMNGCVETSDTFDSDYILPQNGGGNEQEEEEQQQQEQQQKEISVYPNPNAGAFMLVAKVPGENKTAAITITDVMGHVIFSKHAEVKDGLVEEKIDFKDDIGRLCIIKVKAKGCNKTSSFLKQ